MSWLNDIFSSAGGSDGHKSLVARIGAKLDPVQRIVPGLADASIGLADKSQGVFSRIGTKVDGVASKFDPVRRIPVVNAVANQINQRPVDAAAIAAGAYFGGSALGSALSGSGDASIANAEADAGAWGGGSPAAGGWQQYANMIPNQSGQQQKSAVDPLATWKEWQIREAQRQAAINAQRAGGLMGVSQQPTGLLGMYPPQQ